MITTLKLAGMSAILSAGLLSGFTAPDAQLSAAPSKVYQDRLGESSATFSTISASHAATEMVDRSAKGDRLSSPAKPASMAITAR
jgi:hypothetical protein